MTPSKISLVAVATLVAQAAARPEYRERIPNAESVKGVDALGHVDTSGGGARNAFGKDFDSAGKKWTTALCQKDSDGDGQTNGQELGDPCCQWVQKSNDKVQWTTGVSAPGDAKSKSDPTLWASVTCASEAPGPAPTTAGAAHSVTGAGVMATAAVLTAVVANAFGV